MTRTKRALTTLLLLIMADTGFACATSSGTPRDVRFSARPARTAPSMLVTGPALLMHVDVDAPADRLLLYAVARKQGTSADCGLGPTGDSLRLHAGRTNQVNLVVPADRAACVASESAQVSIRWHARRSETPLTADAAKLLALAAHDR
jgi:hypothetical protein